MKSLSYSSMSMYLDCPAKYKFRYVDKIPQQPKHFFSFGTCVHDALEFFYSVPEETPMPLASLLAYYKQHWITEGYKDIKQMNEYFTKGEGILTDFYEKHISKFRLPFFTEYRFDLVVQGVPVVGYIDRMDRTSSGKLHIIDYKTGNAFTKNRLEQDNQLTMYQMACEELLGMKVESLTFYHLNSGTPFTTTPRSAETIQILKNQIVEVSNSIRQNLFVATPEYKKCSWCDFKTICPSAVNTSFISLKSHESL